MTDAVKMAIAEQAANLTVPEDGKFGGPCTYKRLWHIARDAALAVLEQTDNDEHSDDCGCMLCRTEAMSEIQRLGQEFDAEGHRLAHAWLDENFSEVHEGDFSAADMERAFLAGRAHPPQSREPSLTVADAWQDLVDKDDRTSPEEYPDMALITREELADYMQSKGPRVPEDGR